MPIARMVDDDLNLMVFRFFDRVTGDELIDAIRRADRGLDPATRYNSLLVFDSFVDLSDLKVIALREAKQALKTVCRRAGMRPRIEVAVIDGSADARLILPLWSALCDADPDLDVHHRHFDSVEQACACLDVSVDACTTMLSRTDRRLH